MKLLTLIISFSLVCCSVRAQYIGDWVKFGNYGKTGINKTSKDSLLANPVMICLQNRCRVVSFDVHLRTARDKYAGPIKSEGNRLSSAQIRYIKTLGKGACVWIYNVRVRCEDGTEHIFGENTGSLAAYYFILRK